MAKQVTNAVLAEKIDNLTLMLSEHSRADLLFQEKITHLVEGNGSPGMKTRLVLLEESEASRKMYRKLVVGAAGTAVAALIVALFGKVM